MASALPVAFRTLFTCLFIFMFGFCAKNKFFFFYCTSRRTGCTGAPRSTTVKAIAESCGALCQVWWVIRRTQSTQEVILLMSLRLSLTTRWMPTPVNVFDSTSRQWRNSVVKSEGSGSLRSSHQTRSRPKLAFVFGSANGLFGHFRLFLLLAKNEFSFLF